MATPCSNPEFSHQDCYSNSLCFGLCVCRWLIIKEYDNASVFFLTYTCEQGDADLDSILRPLGSQDVMGFEPSSSDSRFLGLLHVEC